MAAPPHIAVARREHDFRVVECTAPFPYKNALKEEARWLALEWWGNCYVESFQSAIGHVHSSVEEGFFLVMVVQRGTVAPDRFIVCLREEEYREFGLNPFRAAKDGLFDFTETFYVSRNEGDVAVDWKSGIPGPEQVSEHQAARYTLARRYLAQGASIAIPTHQDSPELSTAIARFTHTLEPELLGRINICTFTNAAKEVVDHFGTLLCGLYNTRRAETFEEVIDKIVLPDTSGSPFTTIRRGTG